MGHPTMQENDTAKLTPTNTNYETLPTYVRNAIDHPDPAHRFTEQELRNSIELLIKLCR